MDWILKTRRVAAVKKIAVSVVGFHPRRRITPSGDFGLFINRFFWLTVLQFLKLAMPGTFITESLGLD